MSLLTAGGRSATARRYSQAAHHNINPHMQWPSPATLRLANLTNLQNRRRALDLYDMKDVLYTHEQMKKSSQISGSSRASRILR